VLSNYLSGGKVDLSELEELYFTDRFLFEKEYYEILLALKQIRPTEIIIASSELSSILDHNTLMVM
jgi:hypothetical protein